MDEKTNDLKWLNYNPTKATGSTVVFEGLRSYAEPKHSPEFPWGGLLLVYNLVFALEQVHVVIVDGVQMQVKAVCWSLTRRKESALPWNVALVLLNHKITFTGVYLLLMIANTPPVAGWSCCLMEATPGLLIVGNVSRLIKRFFLLSDNGKKQKPKLL